MMSSQRMTPAQAIMCLSLTPGIGPVAYWRLIAHFGDALAVCAAPAKTFAALSFLSENQRQAAAQTASLLPLVLEEEKKLARLGACSVNHHQAQYPQQLLHLADPPPIFYALGDISLLKKPAVAIVGARSATSYGRRTAHAFAKGLAGKAVVISGMALGIDGAAHSGALAGDGKTIGVLGCGLDVVYPSANARLFAAMRKKGLLISEYPMGTPPEAFRFPARNRLIAGLAEAVVVVEAARRSGSLITAQMALDIGREIFAAPGQVDSVKSDGCHWLLQQGARLALAPEQILEELGGLVPVKSVAAKETVSLSDEQAAVLALVEVYAKPREEILTASGLSPACFAEIVFHLELEGLLESAPGDMLRRLSEI